MSWKAVEVVMDAAIEPPTLKLTLAALAHHLNKKTGQLDPSLQAIGDVAGGISRSQARRYVHKLIDMGLVSVTANAKGGKQGTTPHYRLHFERIAALKPGPRGGTDDTPTGATDGTPEVTDGCHPGLTRVPSTTDTGGIQDATGWHPWHPNQEGTRKEPGKNRERVRAQRAARSPVKSPIPSGFAISDRVKAWATEKGVDQLQAHFEAFVGKAAAKGYTYADWDEALMGAIRADWAGLRTPSASKRSKAPQSFDGVDYSRGVSPDGRVL